jgi:hypothetical protein
VKVSEFQRNIICWIRDSAHHDTNMADAFVNALLALVEGK